MILSYLFTGKVESESYSSETKADDADYDRSNLYRGPSIVSRRKRLIALKEYDTSNNDRSQIYQQKLSKIVKTGKLSMEISSVQEGSKKVIKLVEESRGYVEKQDIKQSSDNKFYAELALKVPPQSLLNLMNSIKELGELKSESVISKNIGADYYDREIRLKNKLSLRNRFLKLLERRNNKVEDIIEIEKELNNLTDEIENLKGKLKYYDTWLTYSNLNVKLFEPDSILPERKHNLAANLGKSFIKAFYLFVDVINFLIKSIGILLPLGLLAWYARRRYAHKKNKTKSKKKLPRRKK